MYCRTFLFLVLSSHVVKAENLVPKMIVLRVLDVWEPEWRVEAIIVILMIDFFWWIINILY